MNDLYGTRLYVARWPILPLEDRSDFAIYGPSKVTLKMVNLDF